MLNANSKQGNVNNKSKLRSFFEVIGNFIMIMNVMIDD